VHEEHCVLLKLRLINTKDLLYDSVNFIERSAYLASKSFCLCTINSTLGIILRNPASFFYSFHQTLKMNVFCGSWAFAQHYEWILVINALAITISTSRISLQNWSFLFLWVKRAVENALVFCYFRFVQHFIMVSTILSFPDYSLNINLCFSQSDLVSFFYF